VDDGFRPRPARDVRAARERLSVRGPYVVYVGQARAHKRVPWLIRAFAEASHAAFRDAVLVLVGGEAEREPAVRDLVDELGCLDRIVFAGRLPDDELASLYSGAAAAVSGSVKEGFGLPPAEAVACGSEAIVTDIPAHREVLGPHAHFFRVDDTAAFKDLLVRALAGQLPRRSSGYVPPTWATAAAALVQSVQEALARPDVHAGS
jgi:glycosyltransferase involved in cell wall biosynthesis